MRVLMLDEGTWSAQDAEDEGELRELAFGPNLVWIRAGGSTPEEFAEVGRLFDLHPLALEDVQAAKQRPKVENYPDITFVVVRLPRIKEDIIEWVQVGIFVGKDFVLTASTSPTGVLNALENRLLGAHNVSEIVASDRLFHRIIDGLVDSYFPFLHELEDKLDDLEDAVLERATREELESIRDLKRTLSETRKVTQPMREMMLSLERVEHPNISPESRTYLRDVADHMIRINEQVEHVKEVALIAQETWNATLANQQNELMKRLTVMAGVLLLPALLAGLGGMNFEGGFPYNWNFFAVAGILLAFSLFAMLVAYRRGWL